MTTDALREPTDRDSDHPHPPAPDAAAVLEQQGSEERRRVSRAVRTAVRAQGREARDTHEAPLPIEPFREQIVETVRHSPVTIITAETGSGKSTRVPQYLLEAGYRVVVTQPRRLAAASLAQYVSEQRGTPFGSVVGFRTAEERRDSRETRILYCTDGLQLVRELTGAGARDGTILVIDEVHEWNENVETLIAWARQQQLAGVTLKIVCMSATMDAPALARYFAGSDPASTPAPTITVPGRLFPVTEHERPESSLLPTVVELVKRGRNVLVFQPGKYEITTTIEKLMTAGINADILPLHGDLTSEQQRRVFVRSNRPKVVVSTNVAQTSVTIPYIDAVVDAGTERRIELADGIEGLYLRPTSRADCAQRAGRAGRTHAGEYYLCSNTPRARRQEFPTPAIQRTRLDQNVLRLAAAGIDATKLTFFHQPDRATLVEAHRALRNLGAIDARGHVTPMGHRIARLPVDVHVGRMIIEAEQRGCVDEVIAIAACMEAGSLRAHTGEAWRKLTREKRSDMLAELDLLAASEGLTTDQMIEKGLFAKHVIRAREIRRHLRDMLALGEAEEPAEEPSAMQREAIMRSVTAGMVDHIYRADSFGTLSQPDDTRELARESVIQRVSGGWYAGLPRDHEINRKGAKAVKHLLTMVTKVQPEWLLDAAPHLSETTYGIPEWQQGAGSTCEQVRRFNGQEVDRTRVAAPDSPRAREPLTLALVEGRTGITRIDGLAAAAHAVLKAERGWWIRAGGSIERRGEDVWNGRCRRFTDALPAPTHEALEATLAPGAMPGAASLLSLTLDDVLPDAAREEIRASYPDEVTVDGATLPLTYARLNSPEGRFFSVTVELTPDLTELLETEPATQLTGPHRVRLTCVTDGGFSLAAESLADLRTQLRERLDLEAWQAFCLSHASTQLTLGNPPELPLLPEPETYNAETGAQAYPGLRVITSGRRATFTLEWFRSADEASATSDAARRHFHTVLCKTFYGERLGADIGRVQRRLTELEGELVTDERTRFAQQLAEAHAALEYRVERGVAVAPNPGRCEAALASIAALRTDAGVRPVLTNVTTWFRREGLTNLGDGWVIRADGTLRDPDGPRTETSKTWRVVLGRDLALTWACGSRRRLLGESLFTVVHAPEGGLTPEQHDAVRRIETEDLGVIAGVFGLDPERMEAFGRVCGETREALASHPGMQALLNGTELDTFKLLDENGQRLTDGATAEAFAQGELPADTTCEEREATTVFRHRCPGGVVEGLLFRKFGTQILNVRYRMDDAS